MRQLAAVALVLCSACPREAAEAEQQPGAPEVPTTTEAKPRVTCPPCGMQTVAPFESTEIDGMTFWLCNDHCAELVRKDPARFAQHAIQD